MGRRRRQPESVFHSWQLVEPVESCSIDVDGVAYSFNSKSRPVRGDHPAVLAAPQLFKAVDPEMVERVFQATARPGERRGED